MKKERPLLLISSSQNEADIHYLCGIRPPEAAVMLKRGRTGTLLVSAMEHNRMQRSVKPEVTVIHPAQIGINPRQRLSECVIKLLEKNKTGEVCIPGHFPVGIADSLRRSGIKTEILEKPPCPQRELKSTNETRAVRRSQRAAVSAMKTAINLIASSTIAKNGRLKNGTNTLTSERVRAAINHILLNHDCTAEETIVACGPLSADPHERGSGPLFAGQSIVIDIFPRSGKTGYWGDITRTICRGPAPAALKKQYAAVKAAQVAQLKMLKAGVRADSVHKAGTELMEQRGFKTESVEEVAQGFIHGTGHGVGLEIHEAPRVSPANRKTLKAGHIVTIEPGLYYPDIGGVRIEDTILITKDGYKMLCPCPKKLEI